MKIVEVWPKGYADKDGTSRIEIEDDADARAATAARFGSLATISSIRPKNPPQVPPVSEEYRRMMSQHDNS